MGWNFAYKIMEEQVVNLYNLGLLNMNILNGLMKPFIESDIDHGGSCDLKANDGKSADDIICYIMEPERYREAMGNFIPDSNDLGWNEKLYNLCAEITWREWQFSYN